jgi:hypothetical protein
VDASQREIAIEVGASGGPVVYDWIHGRKLPLDFFRKRLLASYKIPVEAWDQVLDTAPTADAFEAYMARLVPPPPPAAPPAATGAELRAAAPELPPEPEAAVAPLGTTMAEVVAQLMRARHAASLPDISPNAAARLSSEIRALLRLRASLEAQEPITLDKLAHSPHFRELRDRVVGIVRECPTCLDQLIEAFAAVESPGPAPAATPTPTDSAELDS